MIRGEIQRTYTGENFIVQIDEPKNFSKNDLSNSFKRTIESSWIQYNLFENYCVLFTSINENSVDIFGIFTLAIFIVLLLIDVKLICEVYWNISEKF